MKMPVPTTPLDTDRAEKRPDGSTAAPLMNDALRQFAQGLRLTDVVREAIRETWETCLTERSPGRGKITPFWLELEPLARK